MSLTHALATPSYAGDFERCQLLCASVDRFVSGFTRHYLLVEDRDLPLFKALAGPRREIVAESQLLPSWLTSWPDPFSRGNRRIWTGPGALLRGIPPLRGWHTQQLRKFALPLQCDEDVVVFLDSDVMFLRPHDVAVRNSDGAVRLYAKPGGITAAMAEHVEWLSMAARLLSLPACALPATDHIGHLLAWRCDTVKALVAHVETTTGRDWVSAIASRRRFSEYLIYGCFVEQVAGLAASGHVLDERDLCKAYWYGKPGDLDGLSSFETVLEDWQVAVAVQSFISQPVARLRELFEAHR